MQKINATGGLMLLVGLTTQAHAGEYVLQNNGWTLTATASTSTTTQGAPRSDSDTQLKSLRWEWMERNGQDNPTPVQIKLNVSGALGDCSAYAPEGHAYAFTDVYFGFNDGAPLRHFGNFTEDQAGTPNTQPGFTVTTSVFKPYNGAQIIEDTAKIVAKTSAAAFEPDTATANTTTGTLTSFSLENQ